MRSSRESGTRARAGGFARCSKRLAASAIAAVAAAGCGEEPAAPAPEPRQAPFTAEAHESRAAPSGRYRTAQVVRATQLRVTPRGRAVARLGRRTRWGSPTVLAIVGRRAGWLEVIAAERPNGRTGWIPARRARLSSTNYSVRADLSARTVELRRGKRLVRRFSVAIGGATTPTPPGRYAVTDKLRPSDPASPYGCCIIVLSGHQPKLLPTWRGGDRLGIHGTPAEHSVGAAVSLGCLRARGPDIRLLMRRVPLGAPVFIRR